MIDYPLTFALDDNDTILVTSADLPIATFCVNEADALRQAHDAVETLLAAMMKDGRQVPLPSDAVGATGPSVRLGLQAELKIRLHQQMTEAGPSRAELGERLGMAVSAVDRLFDLKRDGRVETLKTAFRELGLAVGIDVRRRAA